MLAVLTLFLAATPGDYPADALLVLRARSAGELLALVKPIADARAGDLAGPEGGMPALLGSFERVWSRVRLDAPLEVLARSVRGTEAPAWRLDFTLAPSARRSELSCPGWTFREEQGRIVGEYGPKPGTPRGSSGLGRQLDAAAVVLEADLQQLWVCCPKLAAAWVQSAHSAVEHRLDIAEFGLAGVWGNLKSLLRRGSRLTLLASMKGTQANASLGIEAEPPEGVSAGETPAEERDDLLRWIGLDVDSWFAFRAQPGAGTDSSASVAGGSIPALEPLPGVQHMLVSFGHGVARMVFEGPGAADAVPATLEWQRLRSPQFRLQEPLVTTHDGLKVTKWPGSWDFESLARTVPAEERRKLADEAYRKLLDDTLVRLAGPARVLYTCVAETSRVVLTCGALQKWHEGAEEFFKKRGPGWRAYGGEGVLTCSTWLLAHADLAAFSEAVRFADAYGQERKLTAEQHFPIDLFQGWSGSLWRMALRVDLARFVANYELGKVRPPRDSAARKKAADDLDGVGYAVWNFYDNNKRWPADLAELARPDARGVTYFLEPAVPKDPWGREYRFLPPDPAKKLSARVFTLGADGVPGGADDDADIAREVHGG